MRPTHVCFDPLLDAAQADAMIELCSRFGTYSTYGSDAAPEERGQTRFAPDVPQRYDAALNFVQTGGRFGAARGAAPCSPRAPTTSARRTPTTAAARPPGIEPFLHHEGFLDAARKIHGRRWWCPNIVYANLLLARAGARRAHRRARVPRRQPQALSRSG